MHEKEKLLWERVKQKDEKYPGEAIRVAKIGTHIGLHESQARDYARKWKNDGYVVFSDPNYISLTDKGREAELPER